MRKLVFASLILLIGLSECFAHGSIAQGYTGNHVVFLAVKNKRTLLEAGSAALRDCNAGGFALCKTLTNFENTCAAVALTANGLYRSSDGQNAEQARANAVGACTTGGLAGCSIAVVACDSGQAEEPVVGTPSGAPNNETENLDFRWLGPLLRMLQLAFSGAIIGGLVLCALALWLFVSVFSTTPRIVLKRKAAISAWIGTPTALVFLISLYVPRNAREVTIVAGMGAYLWTDVFAALCVGAALRRRFLPGRLAADPLSLPLATLIFATLTAGACWLFIQYGNFLKPQDCASSLYSPISICGYFRYDGVYDVVAGFLLLVACGLLLPANSNLIIGYDRLKTLAHKLTAAFGANLRPQFTHSYPVAQTAADAAGRHPPPALLAPQDDRLVDEISIVATSGPMMLKIKKSQTRNFWGTVVFIIDARMEVPLDDRNLIEKYRLGDLMIYSSSARERHRGAVRSHLEGTKGQPGFTHSLKNQLLGALNSFFNFTMAGAHAAMAAYHLKITVYKLMRGVHIRCKDMDEVLIARKSIVEAAENLRSYLAAAQSFDGTEEILEF